MASTTVDMGKVLKEQCVITVHIKMPHLWRWRYRLAVWLIALAAKIAGLGFKTDILEE